MSREFAGLAVDTATDVCSLAVCRGERCWSEDRAGLAERSRGIYGWIQRLLDRAELRPADLDVLAFGAGPGAFTGLRVAASVAQGLGRAAGLPVCPVSSLASLALGAARSKAFTGLVAACLDARMGEVYLGVYEVSAGGARAVQADALLEPRRVRVPSAEPLLLAGPGWSAHPALAARLAGPGVGSAVDARPSAKAMLEIAARESAEGRCIDAAQAAPNYLRDRVAG